MSEAPPTRSFVAAALPLFAFPLAAIVYAVGASSSHRLDRTLLVVWQDNRFALSSIGVIGLLACVGCSLLSFVGSQRASVASFAAAPLSGLVVLTGALVAVRSTRAHLNFGAMSMISSLDLPQFVIAVTKEGLVVFGAALVLATALLFASAAQLAGSSRTARVGGLVSLVAAIGAALSAARLAALNDALARGLRGAPSELVSLVASETSALPVPAMPGATLVVLAVVGLGVFALRAEPRHAVMLALLGPAAAFPSAALVLTASSATTAAIAFVPALPRLSLERLPGVPTLEPQLVLGPRGPYDLTGQPLPSDTNFASLEQYLARAAPTDGEAWRIGLEPGARVDELVNLLRVARRLDVSRVDLIGAHHVEVAEVAHEMRPLLERLQHSFRAVHLLISADEGDAPGVSVGALHAAALDAMTRSQWLVVRVEP